MPAGVHGWTRLVPRMALACGLGIRQVRGLGSDSRCRTGLVRHVSIAAGEHWPPRCWAASLLRGLALPRLRLLDDDERDFLDRLELLE